MRPRTLSLALTALAIVALTPAAASAQIYMWKDASGNTVLSDRPKDGAARTFAVGTTSTVRSTRAATIGRGAAYDEVIERHAAAERVRPELVRAVIQAESAFNPRARSVKGAMGLMQLMPATAAEYGVVDAYDPHENIRGGVAYLSALLTRYEGKEELALAAYNAGPGAVQKYGNAIPPYRETRDYVGRITSSLKAAPPAPAPFRMYRSVQVVDGREVVKYSNQPAGGAELMASVARR
ncbi:MAG: lytic transglycosylase domain-containing protein [Vicinamibacterales bacterium]